MSSFFDYVRLTQRQKSNKVIHTCNLDNYLPKTKKSPLIQIDIGESERREKEKSKFFLT